MAFIRLLHTCIMLGGMPRMIIFLTYAKRNFMWRQRMRMGVSFFTKNCVMSDADTSCEPMVAHAAPSMPQWNCTINSQSSAMFVTAPMTSRNMAVFGWPMLRIKWFMPGATVWNTAPQSNMRM